MALIEDIPGLYSNGPVEPLFEVLLKILVLSPVLSALSASNRDTFSSCNRPGLYIPKAVELRVCPFPYFISPAFPKNNMISVKLIPFHNENNRWCSINRPACKSDSGDVLKATGLPESRGCLL
jgi:hypothetical protein